MIKISWAITLFLFSISTFGQTFNQVLTGAPVNDGAITYPCIFTDFNNDTLPDLFVGNPNSGPDILYYNHLSNLLLDPNSTINVVSDITLGATAGDFNNDGYLDLFASNRNGRGILYKGTATGLVKITVPGMTDLVSSADGLSWVDYDNDGKLDLFITTEGDANNLLYHNLGNDTFSRITTAAIIPNNNFAVNCSWADFDNDGDQDVFIANQQGFNQLFRNDGGGVFTLLSSSPPSLTSNGNSSNWADVNNDGFLDLMVLSGVNFAPHSLQLFYNHGGGNFQLDTESIIYNKVIVTTGSSWGDYDNDGDIDFVMGHSSQFSANLPNTYFQNNGNGTFTEITTTAMSNAGIAYSRGISNADLNKDGKLDLFIVNESSQNDWEFINNTSNSNHWVTFTLVGNPSNRSAIGARVEIKTIENCTPKKQIREIAGQTGWYSQNSLFVHFGLGTATYIDSVIVRWPSGAVCYYTHVMADQFLTIQESCNALPTLVLPPAVSLGADTTYCGSFARVLNTHYFNTQWSTGVTDSQIVVSTAGTYYATITTSCGGVSDTIHIVQDSCNDCKLVVPSAFSPNKDGKNEVFHALSNCPVVDFSMHIYNRWGELVFTSNNIADGWDGSYMGSQQPIEVYSYTVKYRDFVTGEQKAVTGNVTLVR